MNAVTAYSIEKSKTKNGEIFYKIWLAMIILTLFYTFFFQYGVRSIDDVMMLLCTIDILFALIYIFAIRKGRLFKNYFNIIIVFVFTTVFISILFTSHGLYGSDLGIRMIEYVLTAYSIYLLLREKTKYFDIIIWTICISITFLAIIVFAKGVVVTSAGAIGLSNLNVNEMSSYFIMMVFCSFILFVKTRKPIEKIILISSDILVIIVQIGSASRRGFVVIVVLIFACLVLAIIPHYSRGSSKKKFFIYIIILLIGAIALIVLRNYILDSTLLGSRLLGAYNRGDLARQRYQSFALSQFKDHPLFGIGIGGIAYHMGVYSHSLYYEIFSCTGAFLAIILLVGLIKIGLHLTIVAVKSKRSIATKSISYTSCIGALYWASIMVSGITVVMIYDFYFYISIAVLTALITINEKNVWLIRKNF